MKSFDLIDVKNKDDKNLGMLFVKAKIDGREYKFQLDTGSNQTIGIRR